MQKPDESPTTSRRTLLGAAFALPAAALPVAALAHERADAGLIRLADEILALEAETNRLGRIEDEIEDWAEKQRFRTQHICPLNDQYHVLMNRIICFHATTMDGLRAKARVLQVFSNCQPGYAVPYDPEALGWSLANDLLGEASVWASEDEEEDEA